VFENEAKQHDAAAAIGNASAFWHMTAALAYLAQKHDGIFAHHQRNGVKNISVL